MKILSIIIPTYNMSQYIGKCIESLLINEIEYLDIIIVNDGSTDDSSIIAHEYAKLYPDSICVIDKENGNYGSCINYGLKVAKGKYVKIIDADDTFNSECFGAYVEQLKKNDVDLFLNDCAIISPQGNVIKMVRFDCLTSKGRLYIDELLDVFPYRRIMMHNVAYRTQLIRNCGYCQTEGISYTDDEWVYMPMIYVKTVFNSAIPLYKYLVGRNGQTVDENNIRKNIHHIARIVRRMAEEYNKFLPLLTPFAKKYLEERFISKSYFLYDRQICETGPYDNFDLNLFDEDLKRNYKSAYDLLGSHSVKLFGPIVFLHIDVWRKYGYNSVRLKVVRGIKSIMRMIKR